jgi:hypothetical protein
MSDVQHVQGSLNIGGKRRANACSVMLLKTFPSFTVFICSFDVAKVIIALTPPKQSPVAESMSLGYLLVRQDLYSTTTLLPGSWHAGVEPESL